MFVAKLQGHNSRYRAAAANAILNEVATRGAFTFVVLIISQISSGVHARQPLAE